MSGRDQREKLCPDDLDPELYADGPAPGKRPATAQLKVRPGTTPAPFDATAAWATVPSNPATAGMQGGSSSMPHLDPIQAAFGAHDVSTVQAFTGPQAAQASEQMGAVGYAMGEQVAFKGDPDLHTAAHEAAHVVQQRGGAEGDGHEAHADAVADAVVAGDSAEELLDEYADASAGASADADAVQLKDDKAAPQLESVTEAFTLPAMPAVEKINPETDAKLTVKLTVSGSGTLTKKLTPNEKTDDPLPPDAAVITPDDRAFVTAAAQKEFKGEVGPKVIDEGKWAIASVDVAGDIGRPGKDAAAGIPIKINLVNGAGLIATGTLAADASGMTGEPARLDLTPSIMMTLLNDQTFELKGSFPTKLEVVVEPVWEQVFLTLREKHGPAFATWALQGAAMQMADKGVNLDTSGTPDVGTPTTIAECVERAQAAGTGFTTGVLTGLGFTDVTNGDAVWYANGLARGMAAFERMVATIALNPQLASLGLPKDQIEAAVRDANAAKGDHLLGQIESQCDKPIKISYVRAFRAHLKSIGPEEDPHDPNHPEVAWLHVHPTFKSREHEADTAAALLGLDPAETHGTQSRFRKLEPPLPGPQPAPPDGGDGDMKPQGGGGVKVTVPDVRLFDELTKSAPWNPELYKKTLFERVITIKGVAIKISVNFTGTAHANVGVGLGPGMVRGITLEVDKPEEAEGRKVAGSATLHIPARLDSNLNMTGAIDLSIGNVLELAGEAGVESSASVSAATTLDLPVQIAYQDGKVSLDAAAKFHFGADVNAALDAFAKVMLRFTPPKEDPDGPDGSLPPGIPDPDKWLPKPKGAPPRGGGLPADGVLWEIWSKVWRLNSFQWGFDYDYEASIGGSAGVSGELPEFPLKLGELYSEMFAMAETTTMQDSDGPGAKPMEEDKEEKLKDAIKKARAALSGCTRVHGPEQTWVTKELRNCGSDAELAGYRALITEHQNRLGEAQGQMLEIEGEITGAEQRYKSDPDAGVTAMNELTERARTLRTFIEKLKSNRPKGTWDTTFAEPDGGKLQLKKQYRTKKRKRFYPHDYDSTAKQKIKTMVGGIVKAPHPELPDDVPAGTEFWVYSTGNPRDGSKYWYYNSSQYDNERPTFDHKPPVASHWNDRGSKAGPGDRRSFYMSGGDNPTVMPKKINSSIGDEDTGGMTNTVGLAFKGR